MKTNISKYTTQALTFLTSAFKLILTTKSIVTVCFLFTQFNISATKASEDEAFHIHPRFCVSDQQKNCELDLVLNWENISQSHICILSDHAQYPRWCNSITNQKSTTFQLKTQRDIQFTLIDPNNNQILSKAIFKVSTMKESSTRRRYRNPWSLF